MSSRGCRDLIAADLQLGVETRKSPSPPWLTIDNSMAFGDVAFNPGTPSYIINAGFRTHFTESCGVESWCMRKRSAMFRL